MKTQFILRLLPLTTAITATFLVGCAVSPTPISIAERTAALKIEREGLTSGQEQLSGPVTLDEALARALKYNLEYRVKQMEEALARKQLDLSRADLLPRLTAAAGYSGRNNENGASSQNLATGGQSLVPSTSQEKSHTNFDLGLTWNILDFGVSYYQAQQQSDRALVAQERKRKAVHQIMQQVRLAYWQAASAQILEKKIVDVLREARSALADSKKIELEKLMPPLEALNYQRQLLDMIRQLEAVNDELAQAKPRLASLMNLEPGKPYELAQPAQLIAPTLTMSINKMEETALLLRPELMEARYNERISLLETRKAFARLLPGIELSVGQHYDSNSFLSNNSWHDVGLRVSWNLLNILNAPTIQATAEVQRELTRQQHLALSMTVLTQTHVAMRDYSGRLRQYELSVELDSIDQRILQHVRNAARTDAIGKLQVVRSAASSLMSELRLHQSNGALQGAYAQVLSTLGLDPLPSTIESHDLPTLRAAVQTMETRWSIEMEKSQ